MRMRWLSGLTEVKEPLLYKGKTQDMDFRCDLLVKRSIGVELKPVQDIIPLYEAQLLPYRELPQCPKGILINFNCSNIFKKGQKTIVNEYFSKLPVQ
ncbi:GxxExxY protein [Niabella drilacis]|uniref:GxxExxY protein n=1 Tax=Niabella drilacis (strain DSM 25811 / CCM 8410 / CCUG 62505 / LMG 26954 / E90) TaxID=1285928 RepID=A0A1G6L223_NIADE|nr:GxxExxY protein [Niabella drilacis]